MGNLEQDIEGADFRFAKRDELDLGDEDDSDGPPADDEDDSNDEDNWRNDYPDEESYDEVGAAEFCEFSIENLQIPR